MDEVQYLADRVVIISGGRIVAEGTPDTLAGREKAAALVRFQLPTGAQLPDRIRAAVKFHDDVVELETDDPTRTLYDLTSWAVQANISLEGLQVTRPSLEDVYLEITRDAEVQV
jgi:ABC-2 type transport system ATP-binding protein